MFSVPVISEGLVVMGSATFVQPKKLKMITMQIVISNENLL